MSQINLKELFHVWHCMCLHKLLNALPETPRLILKHTLVLYDIMYPVVLKDVMHDFSCKVRVVSS